MFRCLAHITIEGNAKTLELRSLVEFESEQTWRNLTNTAKLKLPRKVYFEDGVSSLIKRGNKITIRVGYGDRNSERLVQRFVGYIAYVGNEVPLVVDCEDEMFMLKQKAVKPKSWKATTLSEVLNYCGITDFVALGSYNLGKFSITTKQSSVAKVLDELNKVYGIRSFYRNGKLHSGNPYSASQGKAIIFQVGNNIEKSDLQYRRKEEVLLKVTAISNQKDGSKIEVEVGDNDGEHRTLNFYNLQKSDLEKQANQLLDSLKYDGYRGSFTAWGEPVVNEGDVVELYDIDYPERDGKFWCDKVSLSAGRSGIRQKLELGAKI